MKSSPPALPLAALALSLLAVVPASAQYFGRNKVQYERFDFAILETEHFRVYHYPEGSAVAVDSARMLERWYERFQRALGFGIDGVQRVILYNNQADFRQTNVVSGLIPEGVGGVTESLANRIVLPLTGIYGENDHVLGHELVHAFQLRRMQAGLQGAGPTASPPLWLMEGMAEYLALGRRDPFTAMWMRDAVLHEDIPSLNRLSRDQGYFPYRYGQAVWAYIAGTWGEPIVAELFDAVIGQGLSRGVRRVLGVRLEELSEGWKAALLAAYRPDLEGRQEPEEAAKRLTDPKVEINLAPAISPDGCYIAYYSRRDPFTLDLYLADAGTGEVIRRLSRSERDAHFDALRFTDSSGSWSPDSRTLAFVVYRQGDNAIALADAEGGGIRRTVRIEGVEAIVNLAWSPDGRRLAFGGMAEGLSHLYLYDLETGALERLDDDPYAELQPAWSPDGRRLAFVTDREPGSAIQGPPASGALSIGLMDLQTRRVEILSLRDGAKHLNPQFAPDGRSLYLVSDLDGVSDLYRYSPDTGELFRVTRLATGVAGLTDSAPCLSVAWETGAIVFSAFSRRAHGIFRLAEEQAAGRPVDLPSLEEGVRAVLPAEGGNRSLPPAARAGAETPLPGGEEYSTRPYRPGLSLLGIGQVGIGVTFNPSGTQLQAPVDLLLGDTLSNHLLGISAQLTSDVRLLGGQLAYLNQAGRLNWGITGGHIPLQKYSLVTVEGEGEGGATETAVERRITFVDQVGLQTQFPFTVNRRLEAEAGYARNTFLDEADLYLIENGFVIDRMAVDVDAPDPLNLFYARLAYAGDYSFFGFTSPLRGSRYRLELQQVFGSLVYLSALADYRQYVYLRWLGLAFRGLYLGRFLQDAESPFLDPFNIGSSLLVRGYYPGSIRREECGLDPQTGDCPRFDRLFGSQVVVFNAEVRLPVFGTEELGLVPFRALPLDLVAFFDGGLAWTSTSHPVLRLDADSDQRIPVFSAGVAARVNLAGAAVLELFWAWPFQRPGAGWQFGLQLRPGW
jgi:Tol biopolymer transport system component